MSNLPAAKEREPIWEGEHDFGNGVRLYRCMDIASLIGQSNFEYFNQKLGWRQVNNKSTRFAMHQHVLHTNQTPF